MNITKWYLVFAILNLFACGGGGGGSQQNPTTSPPPSGGGTTQLDGGLVPGGATLAIDTGEVGVQLDVAVGGTGLVAGDIQRFGSIVVNDLIINTDNASFTVEGSTGSQGDLKQGQQVLVVGDLTANTANEVVYRANIKGPMTSITLVDATLGRADLQVLGQVVRTDATTIFSNATLLDLAIDDLVEVSGIADNSGVLTATFLEVKSSLPQYKVIGSASNSTATTFTIGSLNVDYSSAVLSDFSTATVNNADIVEVRGPSTSFTSPDQLTATEVELLPPVVLGADAIVAIEGFIDDFDSATDFKVQSTPVTTTAMTTYVNGQVSSLAEDVKVQVFGTLNQEGQITADSITIQATKAIRVEGNIENIDLTARTITALGITFSIRDLTKFEDDSSANIDPITLADLGIADEVEIRGYLDGSNVIATKLERQDPEDRARLRGPISAFDAAANTLDVLDVTLQGQDGITEYADINDNPVSETQFFQNLSLGEFVSARWDVFTSTEQTLDQLSLEDDD